MNNDRKALIEEERKRIFAKPIVTQNQSFDIKQIEDFFNLFNLYADNRRQCDIREIVTTAQTLGYDKSHEFIFKKLVDISDELDGEWVGFEDFLTMLSNAMGHAHSEEGRRQAFSILDREGEERITFNNLKKMAAMLKMNLTDDQVQEAIQSIAGKGKQAISWQQFNAHIAKKVQKKYA